MACHIKWTLAAGRQIQKALLVHAWHTGAPRTDKDLITVQARELALCHSSQPFVLRAPHLRHLLRRSRSALHITQIMSSMSASSCSPLVMQECHGREALRAPLARGFLQFGLGFGLGFSWHAPSRPQPVQVCIVSRTAMTMDTDYRYWRTPSMWATREASSSDSNTADTVPT